MFCVRIDRAYNRAMKSTFKLRSGFEPSGDQPSAIKELTQGLQNGKAHQTLLGVTGSGKTFTIANAIANTGRTALVIAHNKTLAAQLYSEFKAFFPENAVEYFVSYYDYYQPEAYLPKSGTYIEKDASTNDEIDKLRHRATMALFERDDVIVVASVSCIYGLGAPEFYKEQRITIKKGQEIARDDLLEKLVSIQYERNNIGFTRGTFRVIGDVVEIMPIYQSDEAIRVEFFGDEIDLIRTVDALTGKPLTAHNKINIYPGTHYVTNDELRARSMIEIKEEMLKQVGVFNDHGKFIEAQRIEERTMADLEMIKAVGYCNGIENYSRYLSGRKPGDPPPTLLDYLPESAVVVIDESHQSVPQLGAMFKGDRSRKTTLVEYGFRLPSALDNRPLSFDEFEKLAKTRIYVSATPGPYELSRCEGEIIEQVVRPTGLIDPEVIIKPVENQVDDLMEMIRKQVEAGNRTLVTCMTKRQAEDLTDYYQGLDLRVKYLHSDIVTLERLEIIRELRSGEFDTLVGINLLREGLDIPEVGLVAILNADMEGFLRSETSIIQTSGRAARNVDGIVVLYADRITGSIERAMDEMSRRRTLQIAYNKKNGITPKSVSRNIESDFGKACENDYVTVSKGGKDSLEFMPKDEVARLIRKYEKEMKEAAGRLEFETAAEVRDKIKKLREFAI